MKILKAEEAFKHLNCLKGIRFPILKISAINKNRKLKGASKAVKIKY